MTLKQRLKILLKRLKPAEKPHPKGLKPCPFCGEARARFKESCAISVIHCNACGGEVLEWSYIAAAHLWNHSLLNAQKEI